MVTTMTSLNLLHRQSQTQARMQRHAVKTTAFSVNRCYPLQLWLGFRKLIHEEVFTPAFYAFGSCSHIIIQPRSSENQNHVLPNEKSSVCDELATEEPQTSTGRQITDSWSHRMSGLKDVFIFEEHCLENSCIEKM